MTTKTSYYRPPTYQTQSNWQPPISDTITQPLNFPNPEPYQPAYIPQTQYPAYVQSTLISTSAQPALPRQPASVQVAAQEPSKIYPANLPNKKLGPDTDPPTKPSRCSPWWWLLAAILGLIALILALLYGLGFIGASTSRNTQVPSSSPVTPTNQTTTPNNPNSANTANASNAAIPTGTTSISQWTGNGKDVFGIQPTLVNTPAPNPNVPSAPVVPSQTAPITVQPVPFNQGTSTSTASTAPSASPSTNTTSPSTITTSPSTTQ